MINLLRRFFRLPIVEHVSAYNLSAGLSVVSGQLIIGSDSLGNNRYKIVTASTILYITIIEV